jgi:hypothetical protein
MQIETLHASRRSTLIRFVTASLCGLSRLVPLSNAHGVKSRHAQLSIGDSLLYQEADGISKLKWIFLAKTNPEAMGRVSNDLVSYYQQLDDILKRLFKQYPASV